MNKIFKSILYIGLLLALIPFTACDNDDDKSGNVMLEAFGPSPALRGGELSFIGKNLEKVTKIILPEDIVITDIERVDREKIRITIPQDAQNGYVTLETAGGKTIRTKTRLSYTEPIEITSIAPSPVKPGATLTVEGDYLNLIQRIIFEEDVVVDSKSFLSHDRKTITLNVPKQARSGYVIFADTAAMPIEIKSKQPLQVVLPAVSELQTLTGMKPGNAVQIKGSDLDLVEFVELPDDILVEFTLADGIISFVLPEGVTDGEIELVAFSGVDVPAATLEMAVPAQVTAVKATGIRAGEIIRINGSDMELITSVSFPNVETAIVPDEQDATHILVTMPDNAISGDLTLNTASGKSVAVAISTLKPVVESYEPATVAAGNEVTLQGTDLDLVTLISFAGDCSVEVTPSSATALTVKVPVEAEAGAVILTMKNGETVTCQPLNVEKPECCYIPVLAGDEILAGTVLVVNIKNGDKLKEVLLNGITVQYIVMGEQLYVSVPANTNGKTTLTLISSNGEISYNLMVIGSNVIETVVFEGLHNLGNWNSNFTLDASAFAGVKAGMILKIVYVTNETTDTWWQMALKYMADGWPTLDGCPGVSEVPYGSTEMEIKLSALAAEQLKASGFAIGGHEVTISKVSLIEELAQEVVAYTGPTDVGNWSGFAQIGPEPFADATVGQVITVKVSDVQEGAQGSLKTPNGWGEIAPGTEYFDITGDYTLTITPEILAQLQQYGLIVGGKLYIIQSVVFK